MWKLREELNAARNGGANGSEAQVVALREEVIVARNEGANGREAQVLALQDEVKRKDAEIDALKGKFINLVYVCVVFEIGRASCRERV